MDDVIHDVTALRARAARVACVARVNAGYPCRCVKLKAAPPILLGARGGACLGFWAGFVDPKP